METLLDSEQGQTLNVEYGGFWLRFAAAFIDGLVLLPLTGLMIYNNFGIKSLALAILISFLYPVYKVFMEAQYGATLGKMAVKLKVVNLQYEKANLQEVILRNIIQIISAFLSAISMILLFGQPGFADATTFTGFSAFQRTNSNPLFAYLPMVLVLIDGIVLLTNEQKQALHDKIAKTYVIKSA